MVITLTNKEIYDQANTLAEHFFSADIKLPIKVNFYLQKNQTELLALAQDIEKQRIEILQEFGTLNEETQQYNIPPENIQEASNKINELFSLTQDVKIYKIKLEDFGNLELTSGQMQALLFMIKDEEEG